MMDRLIKFFKEAYMYIIIIVIVLLVKTFIVAPIRVNGDSMLDTLKNKDIMILNKLSYHFNKIKRFDIIVIKHKNDRLIKRVIGLPGEKIEYKDNILYVNGKKVLENFNHEKTANFNIDEIGSNIVPDDMYFVLGDNRVNSLDSRVIGFIPRSKIEGKTKLTIFPFSRIGNKK